MYTKTLALFAGAAAVASAQSSGLPAGNNTMVMTKTLVVVDSLTTVCAEPTVITVNGVCYTATSAGQTLIVSNCPCTVSTEIPVKPTWVAPQAPPAPVTKIGPGCNGADCPTPTAAATGCNGTKCPVAAPTESVVAAGAADTVQNIFGLAAAVAGALGVVAL